MHSLTLVSLFYSAAGAMDIVIREEDISLAQIGVYASVSFLVVSAVGAALYTTCSKRYRLNWFEQNLLESANEKEEDQQRWVNANIVSTNLIKFYLRNN